MVEVVVVEDDFGVDAGLAEGGAEVFLDEVGLLGQSMSMLGVFFSLSGSFWMVRVSMGMPSAFMPSTYLVR